MYVYLKKNNIVVNISQRNYMSEKTTNCATCKRFIDFENTGEPVLEFKGSFICLECYIDLIGEIYKMAGYGDGGLIHLIFKEMLQSEFNRKRRKTMKNYKQTLQVLLHKYKFSCVFCSKTEELTIDHIKPLSKGGSDELSNLQILCKSCNSKKNNNEQYKPK